MGTSNQNASFGNAVDGQLASANSNGIQFNFSSLDRVTQGLGAVGVSLLNGLFCSAMYRKCHA